MEVIWQPPAGDARPWHPPPGTLDPDQPEPGPKFQAIGENQSEKKRQNSCEVAAMRQVERGAGLVLILLMGSDAPRYCSRAPDAMLSSAQTLF